MADRLPPEDRSESDRSAAPDGGESAHPGRGRRASRELTPLQRALGLLTRREHSRKELTRKLATRGIASQDAEAAVAKLADAGWQDDTRFAQSLLRSRVSSGYGPLRIRAELATHGLDHEAIASALATFDGDWAENARDLVQRRYGEALARDPAARRKAADFLIRRGFEFASIGSATRFDPDA
ncbi:recombination regulator RecX [Lysobacter koreensis]|uniref:Regulatory protein RecX n=1 Tax=Lysobacter koreensis TaxID=266122 RepID=A0ABW2YHG7_9GAMM